MLAAHGAAPFKAVLTHGFTVDEKGLKMSKSLGNVVAPQDVIARSGADILRLCIAATDYREDIRLSPAIIESQGTTYRMIRNTARFCLANLRGFDPARDTLPYAELQEVDRWALAQTHDFVTRCRTAYDNYEFHLVVAALAQFCSVTLSSYYINFSKDCLYCDGRDWPARRSSQTAFFEILKALTFAMAPILSYTAEDIWLTPLADSSFTLTALAPSVFLAEWPAPPAAWQDAELAARWERIVASYGVVMKALETEREKKAIGKGLEAVVAVWSKNDDDRAALAALGTRALAGVYVVSGVTLAADAAGSWTLQDDRFAVRVERAPGVKCGRC